MKHLLNALSILAIFALSLGLSGCSQNRVVSKTDLAQILKTKKRFIVQRNMWWGPGRVPGLKVVYSTNYKMGPMIPVNSEVLLESAGRNAITFRFEGEQVTLRNVSDRTLTNMEQLFRRYFGTEPVDLSSFTPFEQEQISKGTWAPGMSKAAVLVARGYPPADETPQLEADRWTFWKFQAGYVSKTETVHFEAGKIVAIEP